MAKFYGKVGYIETVETTPGVWGEKVTVINYYGDVIRRTSRWSTSSDSTNDDLSIDSQISIVADPFAYQKFHTIKFVEFMGTLWKVTGVEPQYPRLLLTLGGVYNGKQA